MKGNSASSVRSNDLRRICRKRALRLNRNIHILKKRYFILINT
ncbi:hypothetical protein HMPREF1981_00863 [Bacteroides pyogenes F0041]|uniref:Uncharacterized protein n=1 Tax=Bacteroides pyogenes F0041 TaxID=1321819 RepID=U2DY62_9BACE|nr:hypothetical protein HMPREF1981_00863 [Bacteroides pyogenes F0041]